MAQELDQLMRQGAIASPRSACRRVQHRPCCGDAWRRFRRGDQEPAQARSWRWRGGCDGHVRRSGAAVPWMERYRDARTGPPPSQMAGTLAGTSAVGSPVEVSPVVALPGWFVDRRAKSDVRVISGREAKSLMSRTARGTGFRRNDEPHRPSVG
ncbi:MAG: hypothetical protein MZV70_46865 [Desulfobacterales bacterium]|nr:hypothetical protein [Desulfobacterales bacterium]